MSYGGDAVRPNYATANPGERGSKEVPGGEGGGPVWRRLSSAAVGRGEEAGDARVDSRAPRSDCWGEEGEGGEAELLACFDLLLAVGNVGGERRRRGQVSAMARPLLGFAARGEKEEEREQHVAEGVLMPPRGPGCKGSEGRARAHGVHGASASPGATVKGGKMTGGSSPVRDLSFSLFQNFQ